MLVTTDTMTLTRMAVIGRRTNRGIYWDNEKKCYLTVEENEVLNLLV